jgi:glycolate oxidase FAD binding subunit
MVSAAYPTTASAEVESIASTIRDAKSRAAPFRIVGAGSWLDAGRPVRAEARLDLSSHAGIIEYVPGDLTITVRAGTPLAEIERVTLEHEQWLALDPFGSDDGTIGATIATASAGPLATAFGGPRDQVLGVEFITGDGSVVRGGGRVVKNVAGFDLVRLVTGAWGTLGVITEATLRLRARPQRDVTLQAPIASDSRSVATLVTALRSLPFTPFAVQIVDAPLATQLAFVARSAMLLRLGGSDAAVKAQRDAVQQVLAPMLRGALEDGPADAWRALRATEAPGTASLRFSGLPSDFAATWDEATYVAARVPGATLTGAPLRGVVRASLPGDESSLRPALTGRRASATCTRVYERLPSALWPKLAPSAVEDRLSRGLKESFDPAFVLNPGILGD